MIVTFVHVWVKPKNIDSFIQATIANHKKSIKEPGNLRFDLSQADDNSSKFVIYEAYISEDAAAAHKETEHYKIWRDTVAEWMYKPRMGEKYTLLAPIGMAVWE
ncbi:MAG: antibiotic biosynthesis monooxygenase [Cyclobacteriaceae bacterium]|nr:antibiotic biosynthesis monooxygenase [Cyclobacteriaceae bacterium]